VELRQVVLRKHPAIPGIGQGLAIGRDGSVGGGSLFDKIRLARSESDFDE
jgi:hypothetical protein